MNARPFQTTQASKSPRGFALVVTLSLMILLTVIAVGLLSMSSVTMRKTAGEQPMATARANAKLGLDLALDELQKAAGPDQRITAAADILSGNATLKPSPGRSRWVGVWDTSTFNPATPDTKKFVRWLVSSNETTTGNSTTANLTMAATAAGATDHEIFKAVDASGNPSANNSVKVPKVEITTNSTNSKHYYAYWVEDEGLKADLAWKEGNPTSDELKQAARLSAAPGVDYGVFGGPFDGKVKYPITKDSLTDNPWLANIDKTLSPADTPLLMSSNSSLSNWLKSVRHDVTHSSLGVMADVKKGGLRRDLSLAFEMDGVWESPNTPNFNTQTGEFVGNGDQLSAPSTLTSNSTSIAPSRPKGWPATVNERFLWRAFSGMSAGTGTEFSSSINSSNNRNGQKRYLRGPNWWALRDYANLYKRLSGSGGDYVMQARAYFPNRSSERLAYSDYHSHFNDSQNWDVEVGVNNSGFSFKSSIDTFESVTKQHYLYRPARANYAPVNLGTSVIVSILAKNPSGTYPDEMADLAIGLDPLFYFWNPYNRKIRCEKIAVTLGLALPGKVALTYTTNNTTASTYTTNNTTVTLAQLLKDNVTYKTGEKIIFLIKNPTGGPIELEPGEVVIASPIASGSVGTGEAILGYATDSNSGIIMTKLNGSSTINVRQDSKVAFSYLRSTSTLDARHEMDTSLPQDSGITPAALSANMTKLGEQTQHNLQYLWAFTGSVEDQYMSPNTDETNTTKVGNETVSNLVNSKVLFGAHSLLIKPAKPGGLGIPKPHEMFARFNPAPSLMKRDYVALCNPNQIYRHVTSNNTFNLFSDGGINFSGSKKNTFWGASYDDTGSTKLPVSNIPSSPLFSLASFSNANLSLMGTDPFHAVGNSWSSPLISPSSAFQAVNTGWVTVGQDFSWLINDALFDRYYLSGIAPAFTISSTGYAATGSVNATLTNFFSSDYKSAKANPVLRPYLPPGGNSTTAVTALAANDGYKKMGAYSLIDGAFNVNSTSIPAWTAFLRANRDLNINYANGGSNSDTGSPFPGSSSPSAPGSGSNDPKPQWSGFSRLTNNQTISLATRIVDQVKLRGPFMSISDFINHKMGTIDTKKSYTGALQAALDLEAASSSGINSGSRSAAGSTTPVYTASGFGGAPVLGNGTKTTTGIPGDITQAKLLEPLAPRLSARSDTFRIRSYGEVRSADDSKVISYAMCEAVVQRVPEYFDPATDAANNEPWDEGITLNNTNKTFGRRFNVISFRWLTPNEI